MKIRNLVVVSAAAALITSGCGNGDGTTGRQASPADVAAATAVVRSYAELIALAATEPITAADYRRANVDSSSSSIKDWISAFVASRRAGAYVPGTVQSRSTIQNVRMGDDGRLVVHAGLSFVADLVGNPHGSGTTMNDPHVLQLERRDGQWILVEDDANLTVGGDR
jgi:hypothetical protein